MRRFRLPWAFLLIACWSAPAGAALDDQTWHEVRSENFLILTNGDLDEVRQLAVDMEHFRRVVMLLTNVKNVDTGVPLRIFALRHRGDFRRFFAQMSVVGALSTSLRGYYAIIDLSSKNPDARGRRVRAGDGILKHEYVHFVLRGASRVRYPYWYEEGFAEYLSTLKVEGDEVQVGFPVVGRHAALQNPFGLSRIENLLTSTRSERTVDTQTLYAQGWLLVHHLLADPALAAKMVDYLTLYNQTGESLGAFRTVFQLDLDDLQRTLTRRAENGRYGYTKLKLTKPLDVPEVTARPMARTEARLMLAAALRHFDGSDEEAEEVRGLYERVLRDEPGNERALAGLADLALDDGDLATATALLARAAQGSTDEAVLIARGDLALAQAALGAADAAGVPADLLWRARDRYMDVLQRNPRSAEAFFSYGLTYLGSVEEPREGLVAFREARLLVPADTGLFQALMLLQAGEFDEAARLAAELRLHTERNDLAALGAEIAAHAAARDASAGRALAFRTLKRHLAGELGGDEEE
jgi:tetratricopeptide (TPR) repeat protein